jgi:hypothetical protein
LAWIAFVVDAMAAVNDIEAKVMNVVVASVAKHDDGEEQMPEE